MPASPYESCFQQIDQEPKGSVWTQDRSQPEHSCWLSIRPTQKGEKRLSQVNSVAELAQKIFRKGDPRMFGPIAELTRGILLPGRLYLLQIPSYFGPLGLIPVRAYSDDLPLSTDELTFADAALLNIEHFWR